MRKKIIAKNRDQALLDLGMANSIMGYNNRVKAKEGYEDAFSGDLPEELRGCAFLKMGCLKAWYKS